MTPNPLLSLMTSRKLPQRKLLRNFGMRMSTGGLLMSLSKIDGGAPVNKIDPAVRMARLTAVEGVGISRGAHLAPTTQTIVDRRNRTGRTGNPGIIRNDRVVPTILIIVDHRNRDGRKEGTASPGIIRKDRLILMVLTVVARRNKTGSKEGSGSLGTIRKERHLVLMGQKTRVSLGGGIKDHTIGEDRMPGGPLGANRGVKSLQSRL